MVEVDEWSVLAPKMRALNELTDVASNAWQAPRDQRFRAEIDIFCKTFSKVCMFCMN